jgi:hypothetical protein
MECPKNEEGRTGAYAQTDANTTDRQTQTEQADEIGSNKTQTEVRQGDNIRLIRTREDTDKTTTKQQQSQFAVVEDDEQLIVDNLTHPHPLSWPDA